MQRTFRNQVTTMSAYRSTPTERWDDVRQYSYSLLWSSFLDLDAYSASRFEKRFRPYSSEWVVREILWDLDEVKRLGIGDDRDQRYEHDEVQLSRAFRMLALWNVVPNIFSPY